MENMDDASSGGRVTRSLRKRLASIDSETSTSRPTTPLPAKLSSIVELNSPSRPVRMTRRNSTSGQATPSKTPLKGRAVALRSECTSEPAVNSPKRSSRKRSISASEDEQFNSAGGKIAQPKFDTLPEEDVDENIATPSQVSQPHEKSVKRGRPRKGTNKPGPKSLTRGRQQSDIDSDVEIINLEDEEEEKDDKNQEILSKLLVEKENQKSGDNKKSMETINLENDSLVIEENEAMKKEGKVKVKEIEMGGRTSLKPNESTAEQHQTNSKLIEHFSNSSTSSSTSGTKIKITKVESLESLSRGDIIKYIKGDSAEISPAKKNSSKSVAFNNSECDNSMKATYPRTPRHTRTKSYVEVDSSNDTDEEKSFQSDKGSVESFKNAETQKDEQNVEESKEVGASKESVEYFDASNVVGEEETAMEVDNDDNNLLVSEKTPHKSKMLMKKLQSSTPLVETVKVGLESKNFRKQNDDDDEASESANVDQIELDSSLEKSLRSGKRYGSVSPLPSATKSPTTEKLQDMESPKTATKKLKGLTSPKLSPKNSPKPSLKNLPKEEVGVISPNSLLKTPSKEGIDMTSSKSSLKFLSKDEIVMSLPKYQSKEKVDTKSPKPSPQNTSKEEVGMQSPKPLLRKPSQEKVGWTSPTPSKKEDTITLPKPSPKNPSNKEFNMSPAKNPSKVEVGMTTPKPSVKTPLKEEVGMISPKPSPENPLKKLVDEKSQKLSPKISLQKLNTLENFVNVSKAENCVERNPTDAINENYNSIVNASKTVVITEDDAVTSTVAETIDKKNSSTLSFSKSWSQGVSGVVNTSTKLDTITTEVNSKLAIKNTPMKRRLRIETYDEVNDVHDNVKNNESEDEDEEEEPLEGNQFIYDGAEEADENYCSGDSMSEEERQEIEDNEIQINDAESIGSEDTEEDEYDEEEAEKDSFIATDEEYRLEFSDDNEGIEDDSIEKTKPKSYKRLLLQSSSDESDECVKEGKTNRIDNDREESAEDNDTAESKNIKRRSSIKGSVDGVEYDKSLNNADLNESKKTKRRSSIKPPVDEVEHDENFNTDLNESKNSKRRSSIKASVDEVEPYESLNKSTNENLSLNESKKSKRRSSIKLPGDEVEHNESLNNTDLNESKKSQRKSSMKYAVDEVETDEGLNKSTNENFDLNESKKSKRRSSIKIAGDEVELDESLNDVDLNESKKSKRRSSIKPPVDEVEHNKSLNNTDLNESKKSKRKSSIKDAVDEVEPDESLNESTNENFDLNESKKSKRKSSIKIAGDEVELDESLKNVYLNESKKSKRRSSIKPPVDEVEHNESLNNTNLNESKKSKRKSSIKDAVHEVEPDESLNESTNENFDLNELKKSKRKSSIKASVDEVEPDECLDKSTNEFFDLNDSKKSKRRSSIKSPVDEVEHNETFNNTDLNELKKRKRKSSIKDAVDEVEPDEGLNKSTNENLDLNESKKSKRKSSIKLPDEEVEPDNSFNKSISQNNERSLNNSERRKSLNSKDNTGADPKLKLNESTDSVLNASGLSESLQYQNNNESVKDEETVEQQNTSHQVILEQFNKSERVNRTEQEVEKSDFLVTKRKSLESRKSICQPMNEAIVTSTSDSDDTEEDQNAAGKLRVRRAPISQSLEIQREQEYESTSSDDEENANEKLANKSLENSIKQKVTEARSLSRSKLYDNESIGSKIENQNSSDVSKTQLKCANRKSLDNQKFVRERSDCDEMRAIKQRVIEGAERRAKSLNISEAGIKFIRRTLNRTLNCSEKLNGDPIVVTCSESESEDANIEEDYDHSTSNKTEINVSKQKFNKSLNDSKNGKKKVVTSSESDSEDSDIEEDDNKSSLERNHDINNDDSNNDSSSDYSTTTASDKIDFDEKAVVAIQQSSSIYADEKSKLKSLKSSSLSVSLGQIKEKKKGTAAGEITHSSFTIGVSVTKNGESDEQGEISEHLDEVLSEQLASSDGNIEVSSKKLANSSTPHGFSGKVPEKRFLPVEPEEEEEEGEIDSTLFDDATRATLEKKVNDKLMNELELYRNVGNERKRKERAKLALEQALKASANIILNEPGKKKPKHFKKIEEVKKIETRHLPEEILEAVAHSEQKLIKNVNNEPLSFLLPNDNEKGLNHRQHIMKINSGDIVESPLTPPPSLKRKRGKINKFELATGVVCEEPVTPKKEKIRSGFRESPITPRTTGFKVRKILTAGQDTPPKQIAVRKNRKRKRDSDELKYTLPKPKWTKSGMFMEEELPPIHSVANSGGTQFIVSALHGGRKRTKRAANSSGGGTLKTPLGTASANALHFKNSIMFRDNIPRESSQQMLQRKERHRMHTQF